MDTRLPKLRKDVPRRGKVIELRKAVLTALALLDSLWLAPDV